jgi:hypothetical protein
MDGHAVTGFELVRDMFEEVVNELVGTGAGLAVWYDGRWVVDLRGGWADAAGTRTWDARSLL